MAETGAVLAADVTFTSATLSPHRVCSQIACSKQLLLHAAGTPSYDRSSGRDPGALTMLDHVESVFQRLVRDPDNALERPAQVQDRLDRTRNGNCTEK